MGWRVIGEGRSFGDNEDMERELKRAYDEGCRDGYEKAMMERERGGYGERYNDGRMGDYGDGGYGDGGYGGMAELVDDALRQMVVTRTHEIALDKTLAKPITCRFDSCYHHINVSHTSMARVSE